MQSNEDLLDCDSVCRMIGGSKPINPATLYRGIRALRIYEGATEVQKLIVARETFRSA